MDTSAAGLHPPHSPANIKTWFFEQMLFFAARAKHGDNSPSVNRDLVISTIHPTTGYHEEAQRSQVDLST